MIPARSDILDLDEEDQPSRAPRTPTMVNLHFIRSALRRRWLACVLSAVLGLLVASAFIVSSPVVHDANTVLLLSHEAEADPTRAMATDISLLRTRSVAARTVESLGLDMDPDDFLKSVTAVSDSTDLLTLTLTGPTDAEAVRRLQALTSVYLEFRAQQLTAQSTALIAGMQERINKLQAEVATLSKRIDELSKTPGAANADKMSDTISQRAYVQGRIDVLQQSMEDATLQNRAIVSSSGVVDAAAANLGGVKRRIVLALASGLIGGAAIGCGAVLFFAIISDRLRRRADVAAALDVPVPISVGRIDPLPERWLKLSYLQKLDGRRTDDRHRLARAIEMELPVPRRSGRLAVVCIDNADDVRLAIGTAARELATAGRSVALIDLTNNGSLTPEVARTITVGKRGLVVLHPREIPTLATGAADLRVVGHEDGPPPSLEDTDVILILADLDPSYGADYLRAWTDRVLVAVTAGRSSAEMVRTAGDMVQTAGLELRCAALLRTERTDDSSGTAGFDLPMPLHLVDWHDHAEPAEEAASEADAVDHLETTQDDLVETTDGLETRPDDLVEATDDEQLLLEGQFAMENHPTVEMAAIDYQVTADEQHTHEEEQVPAEEQLAEPEQVADADDAAEEEAADAGDATDADDAHEEEAAGADDAHEEEAAGADDAFEDEVAEDDVTAEVQGAIEEQDAVEDKPAELVTADPALATADVQPAEQEELAATDVQPAEQEELAATDEQPADQEELAATDEQPAEQEELAATGQEELADYEEAAEEEAAILAQPDEQPTEEQLAVAVHDQAVVDGHGQDQPVDELPAAEEELPVAGEAGGLFRTARWRRHQRRRDRRRNRGENLPIDSGSTGVNEATGVVLTNGSADQQQTAADHEMATAIDPVADYGQATTSPQEEVAADVWDLYADAYPPVYGGFGANADEDDLDSNWDWDWEDFDSQKAAQGNAADDEVIQVVTEELSPAMSENVVGRASAGEAASEVHAQGEAERHVGNGQESKGNGRHEGNGNGHHDEDESQDSEREQQSQGDRTSSRV